MLTQERLKQLLSYDEATGVFTWRVTRTGSATSGSVAGRGSDRGYIQIMVDGRRIYAHRLAWLYVHGNFPPEEIDHINRQKDDNRIANLRPATVAQNQKNRSVNSNNASGRKGIYWYKRDNKWMAQARLNGKRHYLGVFHTAEAAADAYDAFARKHHGEFYYQPGAQK